MTRYALAFPDGTLVGVASGAPIPTYGSAVEASLAAFSLYGDIRGITWVVVDAAATPAVLPPLPELPA